MKLIDIPEIFESGTYLLESDVCTEDYDNIEIEFEVLIDYDIKRETSYDLPPVTRISNLFISVECVDELNNQERLILENQLYEHIEEYFKK